MFDKLFTPITIKDMTLHNRFSDADALNDILHFRCIDPKTYQQGIVDSMKAMMQNPMIAAMIPGAEAMKAQNLQIGHKRMGYDWMMENNETDWINALRSTPMLLENKVAVVTGGSRGIGLATVKAFL